MNKNLFLLLVLGVLLTACSVKEDQLYNLSASEWYEHIIKDLQNKDLQRADDHYNAMASEHIADPLLETVQIILAQAHMDEQEYQLAEFYLDEYSKKFSNFANVDYIDYLKIRAKFDSFTVVNRNQALMLQSQKEIENFLRDYPHTRYEPLVQTMLTKFNLAIFYLDKTIEQLYRRRSYIQSAQIYEQRLKQSEFYEQSIIEPELPWYRSIFEKF